MAKTEAIRARVDAKLKAQAEGILERLGLNASDAIGRFYRQVALLRRPEDGNLPRIELSYPPG